MTTDNDSVDDGVVDDIDDIITMESVSMEPEDTTGIEESDVLTQIMNLTQVVNIHYLG